MNMKNWLNARCAHLLRELNDTPLTDNTDEVKMKLLMSAMRETSVEMFHRAADNARKDIDKLNAAAMLEDIEDVNAALAGLSGTDVEKKPEPKIKLKSSVIRRVDSF